MSHSPKYLFAVAILNATAGVASAQATLQRQPVVQEDTCKGENPLEMSASDAASCAQDAIWGHNTAAFYKWAPIAAAKGDSVVAFWLGDDFRSRYSYFYAYMWFDIAAQLHAEEIRKDGPTTGNPALADSNERDIGARDEVGQHLTADQKREALRQEAGWLPKKSN